MFYCFIVLLYVIVLLYLCVLLYLFIDFDFNHLEPKASYFSIQVEYNDVCRNMRIKREDEEWRGNWKQKMVLAVLS